MVGVTRGGIAKGVPAAWAMVLASCLSACASEGDASNAGSGGRSATDLGTSPSAQCPVVSPPVTVNEQVHRPTADGDFMRITFLSPTTPPSGRLGSPAAQYVFAGPTSFYRPGLALKDLPAYSGLQNREDRTLYAFRCRPKDATKLSPILATWPAVFDLIRKDLADRGPCGDVATSPENELYCAVRDFEDRAVPSSTASVYQALARAMKVQEAPSRADVLKTRYGIYQEFSGLGYSVKLYGNYDPMTAQVVLGNSMVPEFLVKNVTPAEGDCSCIRVPTYDGRGNDPLDPDFILEAGSAACNEVPRLAKAKAASNP